VREESHLEEMRAALRGERERAEQARQRSLENVRGLVEPAPPAAAEPEPERASEPAPEPPPQRPRGLRGFFSRR
jgi:hypothetical protein